MGSSAVVEVAVRVGAGSGDAVLVAGKGSENYQLIADRVEKFSDEDVAIRALGVAS